MKRTIPAILLILLVSCGTDDVGVCSGGCYLAGDYTPEEAQALADVTNAITDAGYAEPGYAINYVHSPDAPFRGTTWREYRNPEGVEPTDPAVGYGGIVIHEWCMIYINRCGSKEPHLYSLLVHEILHAVGFSHGPEMRAAEEKVMSNSH